MATKKRKSTWLDEKAGSPIIAERARELESFVAAMADGRIDEPEVQAQEQRVVTLMQEVEPLLDAPLHAKVTELLVELTAYDLMQSLYLLHQARPKTTFRG